MRDAIEPHTISEVLEVIGRALHRGELVLTPAAGPREYGAARLLTEACGQLDNPPEGEWPSELGDNPAARRTEAHLRMFNEDALAWLTKAAREGRRS